MAPSSSAVTSSAAIFAPLSAITSPLFHAGPTALDDHDSDIPSGSLCCPTCLSTYLSEAAYIAHLRETHLDEPDLQPFQLDIAARLVRCPFCRYICKGRQGLSSHSRGCSARPAPVVGLALPPSPVHSPDMPCPRALAFSIATELLPHFDRGLYEVFRSWVAPFRTIALRLIRTACRRHNDAAAELATACFHVLPGLVAECHRTHKIPVHSMLLDIAAAVDTVPDDTDFALRIISYARKLAPYIIHQRERARDANPPTTQSVAAISKSIERLVREGRLGPANVLLDRLQRVLSDLPASPTGPHPDDVVQILSSLHPAATENDAFTADQHLLVSTSTAIEIPDDVIPRLLEKLPSGSAAGVSGWTYGLIKALFFADDDEVSAHCSETISLLLNSILSGSLSSDLWLPVRSVLIPKTAGGYRPLGIGEAWYRLAGRAALLCLGPSVGLLLSPLQNGIGVKSGCEIGGRIGQLAMSAPSDLNLIVTSTDIRNGFNVLSRRKQLDGLNEFAPGLLRWFIWAYGRPTPLIMHGKCVGWSATGCRQGDPLSSLLFCVGIHRAVLLRIEDLLRRLPESDVAGGSSTCGVFAFIDDITIFYNGRHSAAVEAGLLQIFEDADLPLNLDKCLHLVHASSSMGSPLDDGLPLCFPVMTDGEPILGCPTGTDEYRRAFVMEKVTAAASSLSALSHLQPWSAWRLLRTCICARLGYLARVLEPSDTDVAFALFDQRVDAAVSVIAAAPHPEEQFLLQWLRSLPLELNGLGLPRFCGLAGDTACLLSRDRTYDFLESHLPELIIAVPRLWTPITLGAHEDELFLAPARQAVAAASSEGQPFSPLDLDDNAMDIDLPQPTELPLLSPDGHAEDDNDGDSDSLPFSDDGQPMPPLLLASGIGFIGSVAWDTTLTPETRRQGRTIGRVDPYGPKKQKPFARPMRHAFCTRMAVELVHYLAATGRSAQARWMRASCFKGSGRWLQGPGGTHFYGRLAFRNGNEYRAALRMRLLLSPASSDVGDASGAPLLCSCGLRIDPADSPFHCLDCRDSQWHHIQRHNLVRDLLHKFLRKRLPRDRIELEPSVGTRNGHPITLADTIADADARQVERRSRRRRRARAPRPQSVAAFREERTRQLREGHFRADIGILSPDRSVTIDVAVSNPASVSYIRPPANYTVPAAFAADPVGRNFAIAHREFDKRNRYRSLVGADADNPRSFVPFVMTACGEISHCSATFLHWVLENNSPRAFTALITQLSAAVARYNAMASLAWVRRLIAARNHL